MSGNLNNPSGKRFSCLLVDDDAGFAGMLAKLVAEAGGEALMCHTLAAARAQISQRSFDLAVLDNRLPDGTGYEFYPQILRRNAARVVVMITGAPELSQAVELTRNGLFDYLTKPVSAPDFTALLHRVQLRLGLPEHEADSEALLGNSPAMREVEQQLRQVARHAEATVLLLGETGTGKDLAARFLHRLTFGDRAAQAPFVALNCPNVPAEMFEAELFGSEKGAYTGAVSRRVGLVEAAENGTLFLDEVAEIPVALQSKLLRFLESREYRSLGTASTRRFSGRVIAATNRRLDEEARAGRFREDLMYRLDVFSVHLPPLRDHLPDVDQIAEALLARLCEKYNRTKPSLRSSDLVTLRCHTFPGNVRELRNLIERSLLRADPGAQILVLDLAWLKGRGEVTSPVAGQPSSIIPAPADRHLSAVDQQEYELIAKTMLMEHGGIRRTAAKLGLTPQALLRRLQKWPELRQITDAAETEPASQPPA
jgi:two-component system, NtrC family, response regulator AtoC